MSTIASKSTLSANRCMLNNRRSNLYSKKAEVIMRIKNWVTVKFKLRNWVTEYIFEEFKILDIEDK